MEQRRICWPDPDATCLEGGCVYCNDHPFRSVSSIARWAHSSVPVKNRGNGKTQTAIEAFRYGQLHHWNNAESRLI